MSKLKDISRNMMLYYNICKIINYLTSNTMFKFNGKFCYAIIIIIIFNIFVLFENVICQVIQPHFHKMQQMLTCHHIAEIIQLYYLVIIRPSDSEIALIFFKQHYTHLIISNIFPCTSM